MSAWISRITILIIGLFIFCFLFSHSVYGQTQVVSPNFEVQFPDSQSGPGLPEAASYSVEGPIDRSVGDFSTTNYEVKAGFQYLSSLLPFSFSLSKINVNFGTLTPNNPSTDKVDLVVNTGGAGSYSVKLYANHPLQDPETNNIIVDTVCDTKVCTEKTAQNWTANSVYGLGYNLSGDDVIPDFSSQEHYRQLANDSLGEAAAIIMSKTRFSDFPNPVWPWESKATLAFKLNISPTQPAGTYRNMITLIALPSF